jgi:hypothetical protein
MRGQLRGVLFFLLPRPAQFTVRCVNVYLFRGILPVVRPPNSVTCAYSSWYRLSQKGIWLGSYPHKSMLELRVQETTTQVPFRPGEVHLGTQGTADFHVRKW